MNNLYCRQTRLCQSSLALLAATLLLGGCDKASDDYAATADMAGNSNDVTVSESVSADSNLNNSQASDGLMVENLTGFSDQTLGSKVSDIQIAGKQLVKTGSANFEVEDVVKTTAKIESLTQQYGGYVELSNISSKLHHSQTFKHNDKDITLTSYYREGVMTVRIPSQKINSFMVNVQKQVKFLESQEFKAQDVTLDIYREELAAQLNKDMANELSQERLKSKNEKQQSSNVNSIIATYDARRKEEYAKLQKMDIADKLKYSTIELTFYQPEISYKKVTQNLDSLIESYEPSFWTQAADAFSGGWNTLKLVVIGIISLWWLWLLLGIFFFMFKIIKNIYRHSFKKKTSVEE